MSQWVIIRRAPKWSAALERLITGPETGTAHREYNIVWSNYRPTGSKVRRKRRERENERRDIYFIVSRPPHSHGKKRPPLNVYREKSTIKNLFTRAQERREKLIKISRQVHQGTLPLHWMPAVIPYTYIQPANSQMYSLSLSLFVCMYTRTQPAAVALLRAVRQLI